MNLKHNDCLNFCAIDASKGICRISKEFINIDSEVCSSFKEMAKCKNCINFKDEDEKGMGKCVGLKKENWTFKELKAITCEGHEFK